MSSFNIIEKFKYNQNKDDIVSLREYIIFDDEDDKKKFVLFKFCNNVNQRLQEFKFELKQYDENDNLVETLVFSYNKLNEEGLSEFVPEAKVKVNYLCKEISIKLIYARFESVYWENNEFKKIPYTFDEYKDSKYKKPEAKKLEKQKPVNKVKKKKSNFTKIDISKKNRVVIPVIFKVFNVLLLIAGIIVISFIFKNDKKDFSDEYFNYEFKDDFVVISSLNCNDLDITIPESIRGYKVKEIKSYAFENTNIKSVNILGSDVIINKNAFQNSTIESIKGDVEIICEYAFDGCVSLDYVELNGVKEIKSYAFMNCTSLVSLEVEDAFIYADALKNCNNLERLHFNNTLCNKLGELFSVTNSKLSTKLHEVLTHMERIRSYFFENVYGLEITLEKDCIVEDNAFKSSYTIIYYF